MQRQSNGSPSTGRFHDQAEHSWTLPASWYRDRSVYEIEKEQIFYKNWWYAGAADEVGEPGQYLTTTVVDQEVLVIRGEDSVLRAFYNVCRHRAHRLLEGRGCKRQIVCPYHGWTYKNDGTFKAARGVENLADFEPGDFSLVAVRVEVMIGLVYVNLDLAARSLHEISSSMLSDMRKHCPGLDNLVLANRYEKDTAANWKTLVDNDLESYHAAIAHRSLMGLLDYSSFRVWEDEFTTCHAMVATESENEAYRVESDDPVSHAIYTWLWPNTAFFVAPGRNNLGIFQMIPTGPETSLQRWDFYFESCEPNEKEQAYLDWTINTLIPEDTVLYENVQRGLNSRGYSQGRLVVNRDNPELSEHHVHQFQKLVRDAVLSSAR